MNDLTSHTRIGFLIFPGFPMSCLSAMIEPLRAANEIAGAPVFRWTVLSEEGGKVACSAGLEFGSSTALEDAGDFSILFLLGSPSSGFSDPKTGNARLRRMARHGVSFGAVSGGVFALARAGLLERRKVSVHWAYDAAFAEEFPDLQSSGKTIVADGGFYTVSGAGPAFDLMSVFIEEAQGAEVAAEVACWFQHAVVRSIGARQTRPTFKSSTRTSALPGPVSRAISLYSGRLHEPPEMRRLAAEVGVSPRHLERQFKEFTGQSPARYFRTIRLNAARQLVLYSRSSMASIASSVGYESSSTMSRYYRMEFGVSPTDERRETRSYRLTGSQPLPAAE
jgi:transcriptional regulator GlxA family with amidase domain